MTCKECAIDFSPNGSERAFLKQMDLPDPALCPMCARRNRYAYRNERRLYRRTCDLCQKSIISCFHTDNPFPVYCRDCWWSDKWDRYSFGRDYNFSRPFFEQFARLQREFPHFQLFQEGNSENCDYCNYGVNSKNCYLCFGPAWSQDTYYSWGPIKCNDCVDTSKCMGCEQCYECVDCTQCTRLQFSKNGVQCHDSAFLMDCSNARNCFGGINLRNRQYVFMGEQLTKEAYEQKLSGIKLDNRKIREMLAYMDTLSKKSVHRAYVGANNTNSTGDYIDHSEDCLDCFDLVGGAKDCWHSDFIGAGANSIDRCAYGGLQSSFVYESMGFVAFNNVIGHLYGRECHDAFYNQYCLSSNHLFGCIGLSRGEYAILNKKVSKEEYELLVPKIIGHMKSTGEWGRFFPVQYSPYGYNETIANDYWPLSREQVVARGWMWREAGTPIAQKEATATVPTCASCHKSFQLIAQELAFYKTFSLPAPDHCPECRFQRRFRSRNPRELHDRACAKCGAPVRTPYAPDRAETIYCEKCYLEEVY